MITMLNNLGLLCLSFSVEAQRIILRKGHVGQNFYFIYSGSVFVNLQEKLENGDIFVKTEAVLSKGDSFGVCIDLVELQEPV